MEDDRNVLKLVHTYKVEKMSKFIAEDLELEEEDVKLAQLIGLLHDIARFEQIKRYNSFKDSETADHADLGVEILLENNLIREFVEDSSYDDIILKAIKNHNKYQIEEGLSERELLHSKIIRDSDKADNFRVKQTETIYTLFRMEEDEFINEKISDHIFQTIMEEVSYL